jgi:hypothetical protein
VALGPNLVVSSLKLCPSFKLLYSVFSSVNANTVYRVVLETKRKCWWPIDGEDAREESERKKCLTLPPSPNH